MEREPIDRGSNSSDELERIVSDSRNSGGETRILNPWTGRTQTTKEFENFTGDLENNLRRLFPSTPEEIGSQIVANTVEVVPHEIAQAA